MPTAQNSSVTIAIRYGRSLIGITRGAVMSCSLGRFVSTWNAEGIPVALAQRFRALEQAAVDEHARPVRIDQVP